MSHKHWLSMIFVLQDDSTFILNVMCFRMVKNTTLTLWHSAYRLQLVQTEQRKFFYV